MGDEANQPCVTLVAGEMLTDAIDALTKCGAFIQSVVFYPHVYRIEFEHPTFDGCQISFRFLRERTGYSVTLVSEGPAKPIPDRQREMEKRRG